MPYRTDASAIARERARLLARLRDLEARFTDVFWQELAPDLGLARFGGAGALGAGPALAPSHEGCGGASDELSLIARSVERLEGVVRRWRAIERRWARPGTSAPHGEGSRTGAGDATAEAVVAREQLEAMLRALRPRMPVDVRVRPNGALRVHWAVATSAPRGAGTVRIEPERLLDDLRKMAGVLTDIEVGDPRFDGVFLVRGHETTVRRVLDGETRRTLLRLGARSADVRVELDGGVAAVRLHAAPERGLVEDALVVLRRLRSAPVRELRRE